MYRPGQWILLACARSQGTGEAARKRQRLQREAAGEQRALGPLQRDHGQAAEGAGRVAEELIFGRDKVSSGASSDIQYATRLARAMVTKWGMSDKLGPLQYEETQEGYLGYGGSSRTMSSAETNKLIDAEIRALVEGAHKRATDILKTHEDKLHLLANALLEYETLTGDEINQLMNSGKLDRPDRPSGPAAPNPVKGSAIPKAGKRFSGGDAAAQSA